MKRAFDVVLVCAVLLWLMVMIDRLGWVYVVGFIGLAFLFRKRVW